LQRHLLQMEKGISRHKRSLLDFADFAADFLDRGVVFIFGGNEFRRPK
jgi:hypothetical protein